MSGCCILSQGRTQSAPPTGTMLRPKELVPLMAAPVGLHAAAEAQRASKPFLGDA